MLWNDPDIRQHRHDVRITIPARHHVVMNMFSYSSSRYNSEIDSHIETIRIHYFSKRLYGPGDFLNKKAVFFRREKADVRNVPVRDNKNMPVIVREFVHDGVCAIGTMRYKILFVL